MITEKDMIRTDFILNNLTNQFIWYLKIAEGEQEEIYYSKNIKSVTGYEPEEVKTFPGRGLSLVIEEDFERVRNEFINFRDKPVTESLTLTYRIKRKDGRVIWLLEEIKTEKTADNRLNGLFGVVIDITEIKKSEATLRNQVKELSDLNSTKDSFISLLSHDLRAPFTSILGFSEILMNESSLSEKEKKEYLKYINESSQNQLQLINYLLDWSRLQTGRLKIEPRRIHAQSMVFNCVSALTGNAVRKDIEIKVDVPASIFVEGDERLLSQSITNLIHNSIKFSHEEKTIEITAGLYNDSMVEFVIKDEGVGIPPENKSKLFKIDKLFSTEGTKGEKGTGLGLALVKEVIQRHKGEIWFYSETAKGTEFHLTVPVSISDILIVVDDDAERLRLKKLISPAKPDYRIIESAEAFGALNSAFERLPSLVILSHDIPLMNGTVFIDSLRKKEKNYRIPVIVLCKTFNDEISESYKRLGVEDILTVPFDDREFIDVVQNILR
ncbi:MAG: hypothetical protein Kow0098_05340 [Ignavibacteriaceae bacterium]